MKRYLIDTAILIFLLRDNPLPARVETVLLDEDSHVFYSPLNVAEVGIKFAKGKLALPRQAGVDLLGAVRRAAVEAGFVQLPLAQEHAVQLATLPRIHDDPFDRLLIAQALVEGLTLVSPDGVFPRYAGLSLLRF